MNPTNIIQILREETRPHHIQIEDNKYAKAIMDSSLSIEEYREYLERFYGFIKPMEQHMTHHEEWSRYDFDISARSKIKDLELDLVALGLTQKQIHDLSECPRIPNLVTFPAILGYLYVIEGSTLGGQLIMKQLKQTLNIQADVNGHYFNSYGSQEVKTKWNEFREFMLSVPLSEGEQHIVIEAAKETFIMLYQWME
ncbi:biliverdin-producing heme oxygenase [Paenibacillus pini]|uniref:Bacteriophytochrome heme oxygenase BphO n=1 Tax=Paenibacillus pini JCM 16418 TaxID=1236976 RepID=W7YVX5_9BACL|nr:biliverdin-producing heme oxygenase [Paenibacillus pini]GAF06529.1 bacteriophytochrome heme oxygenase BphO [Paenibacillus pini JCM 16418]